MINGISSWAGSVVTAVMIVTVLEMMLPEGKNKKYIKTVLGIYLLFTVVSPIIKAVTNQELNIENILQMEEFINTDTSNVVAIQTNANIEEIYETNLKKDIKSKLKQKGYQVLQLELELELEKQENYGRIDKISVKLEKQDSTKKQSNGTSVNTIETVKIEIGNKQTEKQETTKQEPITEKEKQEIKEYLSTNYDVEEKNITIM